MTQRSPSPPDLPPDPPPFPIADSRFDQKNEMFKRSVWDEAVKADGERFYRDIVYQDKPGYRRLDYAFRNGSWNLEWSAAFGNSRSNFGLYSWDAVSPKLIPYLEAGPPLEDSPEGMSAAVKKVARFVGADLVGICALHPNWVYSHEFDLLEREHRTLEVPEGIQNAIVLAVAMDYRGIRSAPTGVGGAATGLGYSKMAFVANLLATFIRGLGYRALPCGNDTALSVPLAMAAGLGEWSRMGLLVTPEFGPRVRLCKVLTDLPLAHDEYRSFGVVEFCESCEKCAERCPSRAIPSGGTTTEGHNISNQSGPRKWYVNAEKCFGFWAKNRMDCATCIRVCPFNKEAGHLHDTARALVKRRSRALNRALVRLDDTLGYGDLRPVRDFWADTGD